MTAPRACLLAVLICTGPTLGLTQGPDFVPQVITGTGIVRGSREGDVAVFRGIPYAVPPVGPLRWRAPLPARHWTGTRMAVRFGPSCWQAVSPQGFGPWTHEYVVGGDVSEDCLSLNVWSPVRRTGPRPVLVWIHGGGFNSGSGAIPIYDGARLAAHGVVVVTINYRLGVFGFLAHPDLSRHDGAHPANFGLLDIMEALRWVRANIAGFGGDPDAVTIAGQSAGAMAVHALVASPAAKGLFQRAIAQSGLPRPLSTLDVAERDGVAFAHEKKAGSLAALRAMPAKQLQPSRGANPTRFRPVADDRLLGHGRWPSASDVPMLVGMTADDSSAFAPDYGSSDPDRVRLLLRQSFGDASDAATVLYPSRTADERAQTSREIRRDLGLVALDAWARRRAMTARAPIFAYVFDHVMPGAGATRWGAFHSSEIPYVFGTFGASPERPFSAEDRQVSRLASGYWMNFITRGDPNGDDLPLWPALHEPAPAPALLRIDAAPRAMPLLSPAKLDLLRRVVGQQE